MYVLRFMNFLKIILCTTMLAKSLETMCVLWKLRIKTKILTQDTTKVYTDNFQLSGCMWRTIAGPNIFINQNVNKLISIARRLSLEPLIIRTIVMPKGFQSIEDETLRKIKIYKWNRNIYSQTYLRPLLQKL